MARRLDRAVDREMEKLVSLSSLTAPLALDYLDRMVRPIPELAPEMGARIVSRSYAAHLVVEHDPSSVGVTDIPVLGTLPPLKRGLPPQDLLSRVVKASRGGFEVIRALPAPVWDGWVAILTRRTHDGAADDQLVAPEVIDGLARFGWVLRRVDIHYGLSPDGV